MLNLEARFADLFGTTALAYLDSVALDKYEQVSDQRAKLFNIEAMSGSIESASSLNSLGQFAVTAEANIIPSDNFAQSFNKQYQPVKYGMKFGISREMMDDQQWGLVAKMAAALGKSAKETQNYAAFNIFNNAFGSTTSWDGVALVSASHTTPVGNQSNTAGAVDLSYSTLQDAITIMDKTQDNRGKRIMLKPRVLLVPSELKHEAHELIKSPYKADTANNNVNSLGMDGEIQVISSPYLTDADAWFLLSSPEDHGLHIKDRQKLSTETYDDKLAQVLYYIASYRQVIGVEDWRGVVGASG